MEQSARRICGSPSSSEDELPCEEKENQHASKKLKRMTKFRSRDTKISAPTNSHHPRKWMVPNHTKQPNYEPLSLTRSKKALIENANRKFVDHLALQMDKEVQSNLCEEFGFGQGYMIRLPTAAEWPDIIERRAYKELIQALGFTPLNLNRHIYRLSSLHANVLSYELDQMISSLPHNVKPQKCHGENLSVIGAEFISSSLSGFNMPASTPEQLILQSARLHFTQLDGKELEILSTTEHERLLSTCRHEEIADAMEDVLARPSLRKVRDRARRMSKLGRIATRRLSLLHVRQSLPAPIEEEGMVIVENSENDGEQLSLVDVKLNSEIFDEIDDEVDVNHQVPIADDLLLSTNIMETSGGTMELEPCTPPHERGVLPRFVIPRSNRRNSMNAQHQCSVFPRQIVHLLFHSGYVSLIDLKEVCFHVCKVWRQISVHAYAWGVADYSLQSSVLQMSQVYQIYPRGHYLSDGAYKEVYKVFSSRHERLDVISVMDVHSIERTGNEHVVRHEVAHSLLLSELVRSRFSPHFVEIYDVFRAQERPDVILWGGSQLRKPVDLRTGECLTANTAPTIHQKESGDVTSRLFQYICMEFCDGGDIEDFINLQPEKLLPAEAVAIPFFFQMVYALFCARERLQLRHCDIKLLNFFLKDVGRKRLGCVDDEPVRLRYLIGEHQFDLELPATFSYWVKLADYGTADSTSMNIGKPVTMDQFTTLENTPVEFLLEGDAANQSFAADTFSLGLCLLHLFTGGGPYEEILSEALCPEPLFADLKHLWTSGKKTTGFSVLRSVMKDDPENILIHTLYRYLVLFGLPNSNPSAYKGTHSVWNILTRHLGQNQDNVIKSRRSRRTLPTLPPKKSTFEMFQEHRNLFALDRGTHPIIKRGRDRMSKIPGAQSLLLQLVAYDPRHRPTLFRVLRHEMFTSLMTSPSKATMAPHYVVDSYSCINIVESSLLEI